MRSVVDQRGQLRNGAWPSWLIAALVFVLLLAMGTTLLYRLQVEKLRQERGRIAQMAAERAQVLQRSVEGSVFY